MRFGHVPAQTGWTADRGKSTGSIGTTPAGKYSAWEFHQNDRSVREVLKRGIDIAWLNCWNWTVEKRKRWSRIRWFFLWGRCTDRWNRNDRFPDKAGLFKDRSGRNGASGCSIEILDQSGNVIESWISADHPHEIIGTLTPGKSYIMRETGAPDGFAYAEEIPFTVSEDGTVEWISMQDKPTHVEITKYSVTEKGTAGARMELGGEGRGTLVDSWVSDRAPM